MFVCVLEGQRIVLGFATKASFYLFVCLFLRDRDFRVFHWAVAHRVSTWNRLDSLRHPTLSISSVLGFYTPAITPGGDATEVFMPA